MPEYWEKLIDNPESRGVDCASCPLIFICLKKEDGDASDCPLVLAVKAVKE